MRDGYLRASLSWHSTRLQMDVLAAFVATGGSVQDVAQLVGIRPGTVKRHLADLRARSRGGWTPARPWRSSTSGPEPGSRGDSGPGCSATASGAHSPKRPRHPTCHPIR